MRNYGVVWALFLLAGCSAGTPGNATRNGTGTTGGAATTGSSGAGSTATAGFGGPSTTTGQAGATATGDGTGAGTGCSPAGTTRSCCGTGTQTCSGSGEFPAWGECVGAKGATMMTCSAPSGCGVGEFGPNCPDSGSRHVCGEGEFGPQCLDAGTPHVCGPGEFGPGCDAATPLPPPTPALCTNLLVNTEPGILAAYSPTNGQSVAANGQIKVWVNDERPEIIAPNEVIDPSTGMITAPGDRTARAADGYLWEPALYIAPQTAESGGTPHFPQAIKGWYNNTAQTAAPTGGGRATIAGTGVQGAPIDTAPAFTLLPLQYTSEVIWDVSALGLSPGTYAAEFSVHDGDRERAIGCVTIVITGAN